MDENTTSIEHNRFILGQDFANKVAVSPVKSRWSTSVRHSATNSSKVSQFSTIRNRNYILACSPQHQQNIPRVKRNSSSNGSRRIIDFSATQETSYQSSFGINSSELSEVEENVQISDEINPCSVKLVKSKKGRVKCHEAPITSPTFPKKRKKENVSSPDKASVKELIIPTSVTAKWTPISEKASGLLLDSIVYSSGLVGVGMVKKKVVEQTIENLVTKVRNELNAAKAPRMGRLKSYSDIRLDLEIWKEEFLTLVNHNDDMENLLDTFKSLAKDQQEKAKIFSQLSVTSACEEEAASKNHSSKDWTLESKDVFCDYLVEILKNDRHILVERVIP